MLLVALCHPEIFAQGMLIPSSNSPVAGQTRHKGMSFQPALATLAPTFTLELAMGFLSFLVLCVIAFFLWRISDQMPDVLFRLSEVQKDIAEMRRQGERSADD